MKGKKYKYIKLLLWDETIKGMHSHCHKFNNYLIKGGSVEVKHLWNESKNCTHEEEDMILWSLDNGK